MKKGIFLFSLLILISILAACDKTSSQAPKEIPQNRTQHNQNENSEHTTIKEETPSTEDLLSEHSATIFAMDTVMTIKTYGGNDQMLKQVEDHVQKLENLFSTTKAGSDIYTLNQNGFATMAQETEALLGKALELCNKTQGALDISIYPIVKAWGFTTGEYQVPDEPTIQQLLTKVDYSKILHSGSSVSIEEGMEIDFGSVAKGYTADDIVDFLKKNQISSALINLGGNVHALGTKPDGSKWRIAIQDPQSSNLIGTVAVSDLAVVTSGGYERYFENNGNVYWHIMDPKTGYPANNGLISVSIICPSGLYADALSTSLFIKGLEESIAFWRQYRDFEAVFVDEQSNIYITEGLKDTFSLMDSSEHKNLKIIQGQ